MADAWVIGEGGTQRDASLLGPAKPARSSQVRCVTSSGEASGSGEFVDGVVVGAGGGAEFGGHGWAVDLG